MKKLLDKFFKKIGAIKLSILIVILAIAYSLLFIYDVGINSKFHVKKDFEALFVKRMTGNCDGFGEDVSMDKFGWIEKCTQERDYSGINPIENIEILKIDFKEGIAYLQVKVFRNDYGLQVNNLIEGKEVTNIGHIENYTMNRSQGRWLLNQKADNH